jgi:hypothetical protein
MNREVFRVESRRSDEVDLTRSWEGIQVEFERWRWSGE